MNMVNSPKIAIIIPAYNESATITSVVSSVSIYGYPIVVNDGSTDNTDKLASSAGALVISLDKNQGYDSALSIGIATAIKNDYDYAITIDADGQHDPSIIIKFVDKLMNNADLVVGVRNSFQRPSEFLFGQITKLLWGLSDPLCGMKGYRLSKFRLFDCLSNYNSVGTELTIRALRSGWNFQEVSIETFIRTGKSRFGSGLYANFKVLKAMIFGLLMAHGL